MQYLEIGQRKLEYRWYGQRSGTSRAIVFLHDGLGCVSAWRDFPAQLAEATGCAAVAYSRAGYGDSDSAVLPRSIRFMHEEALETLPRVLDALGLEKAILFGHSDGGSISLIHAASPAGSRIVALLLEAPHVFVEDITVNSIAAAGKDFGTSDLRRRMVKHHGPMADAAFWGWHDVWVHPEFRNWNIEEVLPALRLPVLVIQGEEDAFGSLGQLEAVKHGCGGPVQALVLGGCGHSPHRDRTQLTLSAASEFVRRIMK